MYILYDLQLNVIKFFDLWHTGYNCMFLSLSCSFLTHVPLTFMFFSVTCYFHLHILFNFMFFHSGTMQWKQSRIWWQREDDLITFYWKLLVLRIQVVSCWSVLLTRLVDPYWSVLLPILLTFLVDLLTRLASPEILVID